MITRQLSVLYLQQTYELDAVKYVNTHHDTYVTSNECIQNIAFMSQTTISMVLSNLKHKYFVVNILLLLNTKELIMIAL